MAGVEEGGQLTEERIRGAVNRAGGGKDEDCHARVVLEHIDPMDIAANESPLLAFEALPDQLPDVRCRTIDAGVDAESRCNRRDVHSATKRLRELARSLCGFEPARVHHQPLAVLD